MRALAGFAPGSVVGFACCDSGDKAAVASIVVVAGVPAASMVEAWLFVWSAFNGELRRSSWSSLLPGAWLGSTTFPTERSLDVLSVFTPGVLGNVVVDHHLASCFRCLMCLLKCWCSWECRLCLKRGAELRGLTPGSCIPLSAVGARFSVMRMMRYVSSDLLPRFVQYLHSLVLLP